MKGKRKYYIVVGSKAFFENKLSSLNKDDEVDIFLELVKQLDAAQKMDLRDVKRARILVVKNENYHGIRETAHDMLGSLIEDLTTDDAQIYIHNPTRVLKSYLEEQCKREIIQLESYYESYEMRSDPNLFAQDMREISESICGQKKAIDEISKSLWYLVKVKRKRPYVIMLYGNSSLGKTEMVREIARKFFDGKHLEKHLSMFKNDNYSHYFFGDAPNRKSLAYDLLERESNLVFFDEIDKCPEHFFSTFYTLFDNVEFKDITYDVDVSGIVIMLTSNYKSEEEMKKQLGLPLFYRIDKCVHFEDLSCEAINQIVMKEVLTRKEEYDFKLTPEDVYKRVCSFICVSNENARTIKHKVQKVIEEILFEEVETRMLT